MRDSKPDQKKDLKRLHPPKHPFSQFHYSPPKNETLEQARALLASFRHEFSELRFRESHVAPDSVRLVPDFDPHSSREIAEGVFNYDERKQDLVLDRETSDVTRNRASYRKSYACLELQALKACYQGKVFKIEGLPEIVERPSLSLENYKNLL